MLFLVKLRWPKKESFTESFTSGNMTFGASSYEPDQPGWLGSKNLTWPLFPSLQFRCDHIKSRADPGFCDRDLVRGGHGDLRC